MDYRRASGEAFVFWNENVKGYIIRDVVRFPPYALAGRSIGTRARTILSTTSGRGYA